MLQNSLSGFLELCNEIHEVHNTIITLLPQEEKDRPEIWLKAKMMFNDDVVQKC